MCVCIYFAEALTRGWCFFFLSQTRQSGTAPAEYISYDLWQAMRHQDETLADTVLEPTFVFMRAQTDKLRLHIRGFGPYFDYREKDVGKG